MAAGETFRGATLVDEALIEPFLVVLLEDHIGDGCQCAIQYEFADLLGHPGPPVLPLAARANVC